MTQNPRLTKGVVEIPLTDNLKFNIILLALIMLMLLVKNITFLYTVAGLTSTYITLLYR